jgi:septal ring-binding cell division protein DamX
VVAARAPAVPAFIAPHRLAAVDQPRAPAADARWAAKTPNSRAAQPAGVAGSPVASNTPSNSTELR